MRPACLVALLAMGWGASTAVAESPPPPLRLAMSGAFQPFSTTDATGALVGLDADIARELATRMGRTPELVQVDWAGIQAALQQGKVDLICGSMAITPARRAQMHFTLPYYVSGAQLFARADLNTIAGARIGVTEDSTYATFIDTHPDRFPNTAVTRYGSEAELVTALGTDKIDAFVSDRIVGGFYASRASDDDARTTIVPQGSLLYDEACGIAARKEDDDLVRAANAALFSMLQDGTYARIYERWVGAPPDTATLLDHWQQELAFVPGQNPADDGESTGPTFADDITSTAGLLLEGAWLTLVLSLLTALFAFVTGTAVGTASVSPRLWLSRAARAFIVIVRGTPLLVQLFIAYFAVATALNRAAGVELMGAFGAALFALVVNTTAYNAETWRGGILSVDEGQWQAAYALGMTRPYALRRVILPQAFRSALPSFGNNLVVLVKDTSLVGAITLVELTYAARNIVFQSGRALMPFAVAALFYLAIISSVSFGVRIAEQRFARETG